MRFLPNRSEFLALVSVWMIYPALFGLGRAMSPGHLQCVGTLQLGARLGIAFGLLVERGIPSAVGTALLVAVVRFVKSENNRLFLCHLLTFVAFGFTVIVMILASTVFNSLSER